jgi:hypothetical protein
VGNFNRSLALEEVTEVKIETDQLLPMRNLSISDLSTTKMQHTYQIVQVSGHITVSF